MEESSSAPETADIGRSCGGSTENRDSRGRFGRGNPGRKVGSRNRATLATLAVMEKDAERLGQKAVDMALAGDSTALRLCLERLAPPARERTLQIAIPLPQSPADVPATMRAILQGAAEGMITASEAERLTRCVEAFTRAHELAEFDVRLRALEGRNAQ